MLENKVINQVSVNIIVIRSGYKKTGSERIDIW